MHSNFRHFAIASSLVPGGQPLAKLQQQLRRIQAPATAAVLAQQWQDLRRSELRETSALLS